MSLITLTCNNAAEYTDSFEKARQLSEDKNLPFFTLLTGTVVPETGKSWCPDCANAEPVIHSALETLTSGCVLLVGLVQRAAFPEYRDHPLIRLKCVPTFTKWTVTAGKPSRVIGSLDDSQSQKATLVKMLVEAEE